MKLVVMKNFFLYHVLNEEPPIFMTVLQLDLLLSFTETKCLWSLAILSCYFSLVFLWVIRSKVNESI